MERIAILGGGTMGAGIAQLAVTNGCEVRLLEANVQLAQQAIERISRRIDREVEKHRLSSSEGEDAKNRLHFAEKPEALTDCPLVIEAIVEDLEAKIQALMPVAKAIKLDAIIASNTSSLSISKLGEELGIPERVCGMHFFNPAPVMPLVEIIRGDRTDPETIERAAEVATEWGKPVVHVKDTPGFIVNRVARPFYLEALRILEEKKASCDGVDLIVREVGGFRMGPFELMDLVGIDINYTVTLSVYEQSGRPPRFKPCDIQARLVDQNKLGRKVGSGFYDYTRDKPELNYRVDVEEYALSERLVEAWKKLQQCAGWEIKAESGYILARILCALFNEAAHAEEQGVATAEDIDVAMKLGTNYPKGLLAWANEIGHGAVGEFLRALNASVTDGRFAPAGRFAGA